MEQGIYSAIDIPMSKYLADPCDVPSLSSGCAHTIITRSPLHAWWNHPRLGGRKSDDSNVSDMGSVAHDLLLGGEGKVCVIEPSEYRSKPTKLNPEGSIPDGWTNIAIREARDTARANGLTPILAGAYEGAKLMAEAGGQFAASSEIAGVFDNGIGEQTLIWEENGTWFRARPDWMNFEMKIMLHLKTTKTSAAPAPFIRGVMESMGYDVPLAFYRRGLEAIDPAYKDWLHVMLIIEQDQPHACSLISLDPAKWAIADGKVEQAIWQWQQCMARGRWPAYSSRIHYASPSAWQLAEAEERQAREKDDS